MLLCYLDESYTKDCYWIVALVCPEGEASSLSTALDSVVEKAADNYVGISEKAELHGHALFQGKEDWSALKPFPRARIGVYAGAFTAIAAHDIEIIIRGVDIPRLTKRYSHPEPPHAVVLSHLLERIDELAAARGEWALVIADEIDQADQYRRNLWRFQRYKTIGYRARKLERIVDTIHFAPSRSSRLVQGADMLAYLYQRIDAGVDRDARAVRANQALWNRVSAKVVHCHCWWP